MDTPLKLEEYGIYERGNFVGVLATQSPGGGAVARHLTSEGYALEALGADGGAGGEIVLDAACTIEDHRPCDVKVSIAAASEVAEQAQLPSRGKLHQIQEAGVVSIAEAESVLRVWADEVRTSPGTTEEQRNWADVITEELFPAQNSKQE